MTATEEYLSLMESFGASEAWLAHVRLNRLKMSADIFFANADQLLQTLRALKAEEAVLALWAEENAEQQERAMTHVMRLMYNYLSSARSLNHHLDKFKSGYRGEFRREFNRQLSTRWRRLPVTSVVEKMRNLFVHEGIPSYELQLSVDFAKVRGVQNGVDVRVTVDVSALLANEKLRKMEREFLEGFRSSGRLEELVEPYTTAAHDFMSWLVAWHQEVAEEELFTELRQMHERALELQEKMEREQRNARSDA